MVNSKSKKILLVLCVSIFLLQGCGVYSDNYSDYQYYDNSSNYSTYPNFSKNEMYYLGIKAVADYCEVDSSTLLWDSRSPGVSECDIAYADDGGLLIYMPFNIDDEITYIVCEAYSDGSCMIVEMY